MTTLVSRAAGCLFILTVLVTSCFAQIDPTKNVLGESLPAELNKPVRAQQVDSIQREVWQAVETRWRLWQAGDLEKMLALYHPRFHAWNRVSGGLDGRDSMLARWRRALQSESILAVKLEPIVIESYGDFAAVFYVSRETVKVSTGNRPPGVGSAEPTVVTIRWSDYLVRDGNRWLFAGYGGLPCSQSEPTGSVCRSPVNR